MVETMFLFMLAYYSPISRITNELSGTGRLARPGGRRQRKMFRKLIHRIRKRRFCKANRWFCPDCIYHEHLFDGVVYRGVRCHYPTEGGGEDGN